MWTFCISILRCLYFFSVFFLFEFYFFFFFFQAEDGIRDGHVTGVQTCALPICCARTSGLAMTSSGAASFIFLAAARAAAVFSLPSPVSSRSASLEREP